MHPEGNVVVLPFQKDLKMILQLHLNVCLFKLHLIVVEIMDEATIWDFVQGLVSEFYFHCRKSFLKFKPVK